MNKSSRHHYIPEFFRKGFTGEDGKIAVFNKLKDRIEKVRKSPKQVFYEWNSNTFNIKGNNTDFVENLHQFGEDKFAPTYKRLTEKLEVIDLTPYELLELILFISTTHRRVPKQDEEMSKYVKNLSPNNKFFSIKNRKTGGKVSEDIFNRVVNEPAFIEGYKIMKAIEDYFGVEKNEKLKNWKLYYVPKDDVQLNLLSDNPLIVKDSNEENILKCESVFPLSKGKTVYHTNGKILNEIPAKNRISVDILNFIQSTYLVCGPNTEYLYAVSELAKNYDTKSRIQYLKDEVFEIFS